MINYPAHLPSPHFASGITQQSNFLRSALANGRVRQRRKHSNVPSEQTIEWRLKADQAADFLEWVQNSLSGGIAWFEIRQRTEFGIVPLRIRMTAHPLENASQKSGRFIYSVKCEIYRYPMSRQDI